MGINRNIPGERKRWVIEKTGKVLEGLDQEAFDFVFRAMHDYNMSLADADQYAWLNTLFGYDIGAERAKGIIEWYDEQDIDVLELDIDQKETLQTVCKFELGFQLDFSKFAEETPEAMRYRFAA